MSEIHWQRCGLGELSPAQLYAVFAARSAVFVVEQNSIYQDLDGMDFAARHIIGWAQSQVAAYSRLLGPATRFAEPSIGRVLTTQAFRSGGLGRELMAKSIEEIESLYPARAVRLGAQAHLERFYASFGFAVASEPYIEDGIPHIEMLRPAQS